MIDQCREDPSGMIRWQSWPVQRRSASQLRVYCFAHAGGPGSVFLGWQKAIGSLAEIRALVAPGRGAVRYERPLRSITPLVDAIAGSVRRDLDRGEMTRYALAGCSMGAAVALALLERLRDERLPGPEHLVVCAGRPPVAGRPSRHLSALGDDELRQRLLQLDSGRSADPVFRRSLQQGLELVRADLELLDTYSPRQGLKVPCPLSVFVGLQDSLATPRDMVGWRQYASGPFRLRYLNLGHFFFILEPNDASQGFGRELRILFESMSADRMKPGIDLDEPLPEGASAAGGAR